MLTGKVKMWNADKGYGFITPDAGGVDLFCHISSVAEGIDALREGQKVSFSERQSRKKPGTLEAVDVQVI
jgi:cold shock protein